MVFVIPEISAKILSRATEQSDTKGPLKTLKVLGLEGSLGNTKYNAVKISNGRQLPI